MSESPNTSRTEVDEILSKRRKHRGGRACYPCSKRKVKCDSSEHMPCTTCVRRGHPEICSYKPNTTPRRSYQDGPASRIDAGPSKYGPIVNRPEPREPEPRFSSQPQMTNSPAKTWVNSETRRTIDSESSTSYRTTPAQTTSLHVSPAFEGEESYLGENSAAALVRGQIEQSDSHRIVRDIRPVLGLQNTSISYPYMTARTSDQTLKEVFEVLPQSEDILRFEIDLFQRISTETLIDTFTSIER